MIKILVIAFWCIAFSFNGVNIIGDNTSGSLSIGVLQDTIYPNEVKEATGPEWPEEIPFDIPEFSEGTMVSVVCNDPDKKTSWTIIYHEVIKDALSNYKDLFNANDFKTSGIIRKNGASRFTATQDGIKVVTAEKNGTIELIITTKF